MKISAVCSLLTPLHTSRTIRCHYQNTSDILYVCLEAQRYELGHFVVKLMLSIPIFRRFILIIAFPLYRAVGQSFKALTYLEGSSFKFARNTYYPE
jgi:hypothetical protein